MSEATAIAIVGMAGRFPGARDTGELWRNLRDGVESIASLTGEELAAAGVEPALLADPRYVRAKGCLEEADRFDAAFFGFTPREAEAMDPQHRVFLECAWEALEDAGCDPRRLAGRAGVWAGSGASSYLIANLLPNRDRLEALGGLQVVLLNDRDFLATRVSYELDLKGPSVSVQTACSTSLVAVHMACQSLLGGECDLALAGGVSISSPLRAGYLYQEGSVLSPDGHCRAFDAAAAGSVEGNGCGVVVLKRLADALADGDRVYAVIRGSAVNNDGAAKIGFTAPSVEGQAEVISESLLMAGVAPETIGYVEAHGSGTPLGDPIEVAALTQAFRAAGAEGQGFCALGSVKTNFGHCNTAAGVAGLMKATLALVHRTLPPSLHFANPNPQIDFAAGPFYVPTVAVPWETNGTPRRAGVSSFGLGGTNAHLVLEEAPEPEPGDAASRPAQLLVLSARTPAALDAATARLAEHLEGRPDQELADVAWTLQTGRQEFEHRRIVVVRDSDDCGGAAAALRDPGRVVSGRREGSGSRPVVFLFPGLGDQSVGMAREIYASEPVFREQVDLCAGKLVPWLGADLRDVMFATSAMSARESRAAGAGPDLRAMLSRDRSAPDPAESRLRRPLFAQPACFVVEYALARLLMSWGIVPQALIGYSVGEYVAAALSGALELDDALALVARRAKLIESLPAGAMLAVPLAEEEVRPSLSGELSLAATNGPHFCVVGGPEEAVAALDRRLTERGVSCLRLRTTHAFHSSMMEPAVAALTEIARGIATGATGAMDAPRIPWISNVTGTWITAYDLADPSYWARHMRGTVRFAEGIGELLQEPDRVFLEVGPGATLGTLVKQHPAGGADRIAIPTLREGTAETDFLLEAVGRLWIAGVGVDWPGFHNGERRRKVALPTYPFERQRFWLDPPAPSVVEAARPTDLADWFWVPSWKQIPLAAPAAPEAPERWLIFLDDQGLGERIAMRLRQDGHQVSTMARGEIDAARRQDYDALLQDGVPEKILHLWGVTADEPDFAAAQTAGIISLTLLAQAVSGRGEAPVRLLLVANGLHELADGDPLHPGKATVLGALKVVHQEVPRLSCGSVDVALPVDERLVDQLLAEMAAPAEHAVALRGRQRWVRGFETVRLADAAGSRLIAGGVYLIAGAAHGPGRALAEHLVRSLGARVGLVLPPHEPPPELESERTLILRAEPGDAAGLRAALAATRDRFGPVHGVFFTGTPAAGGLLQLKTADILQAALDPLARDAEALLATVDAEAEPPAFTILSSTTTAVTGSLGQLEMAAAGAFLEALPARRAAEGRPFTMAVHWDPYQWDGWLISGVSGVAAAEVQATLEAHGVDAQRSAEALRRLLASPLPRVIVSSRDLPGLLAETDSVTADTFLAQMAAHAGEKAARPELATFYEPPRDEVEEKLTSLWQELFGIAPIGRDDNFLELGGHSLLAIQIVTQVRALLQADLPVTAVFEAPTIAQLGKAVRRARGEEDPEELEALLAMVEGLSPEEAAARLAELGV